MRTKAVLFFLMIASAPLLKAQRFHSFTHDVDSVLSNLNKSYIPTGILYDRVYPYARLHIFNTSFFDTTNVHHFIQGYFELYNAKYINTNLVNPDTVDERIKEITATGKVPIGIINFQFNQIDTNSLADNLLENRNGIFYDVPDRMRSPYWNKQVSIISPLIDSTEGLSINFQTSSNLYLQNTGHTISSLNADFNNGSGLISIGLNSTITINYSSYGKKIIKFIIRYQDNTEVISYAFLKLTQPKQLAANITSACDKDDYIIASIPFTDYENHTFKGQGNIHYYFATNRPCNGKVKKPVIVLDGFDPGDEKSISELYDTYLNNPNRYKLGDELRSKGYDIVVLNFPVYTNEFGATIDGGSDYIERNAFVLIELINKLKRELRDNNSQEKLVIIGPSMGGIISRYALAYMEKNNMPHKTRLWISFDAPHNGANVPIGAQKYVEFFAGNGIKEAQETLEKKLNTPASKQQMLHHYLSYSDSVKGAPGFRDRFAQALASNGVQGSHGFPVLLRKIALVDGSLDGTLQPNSAACQMALNSKTYFTINLFLFKIKLVKLAEASIYFAGSYGNSCTVLTAEQLFEGDATANGYAPATSASYDIVPGGYRNSFSALADEAGGYSEFFQFLFVSFGSFTDFNVYNGSHSHIPTKSALAFTGANQDLAESVYDRNLVCTGETPFDTYYGGTTNLEHAFIDSGMAHFGIEEITGKHREPSYVTSLASLYISGPDKFCTESGTYSLQGGSISQGTSLTWSVSPDVANIISDKYNQQIQLSRISNGTATLKLALNRACGLNQKLTKTFSIGGYGSGDYPITGPTSACENNYVTYTTRTLPDATNYNWFYPAIWTYISGQNTPALTLKASTTTGNFQIGVRVASSCDAGGSPALANTFVNNCGGFAIEAFPNPSPGEVFITTGQIQSLKTGNISDMIYKLEVIDQYGGIRRTFSFTSGVATTKINLSNLASGAYFIHVFNGKVWSYKKIIIAR